MPGSIEITPIGSGGGRLNIVIKNEDGSKTTIKVRPNKTEVTTTDSEGNTSSGTVDVGSGPGGGSTESDNDDK
jgi:hypothetical protein